MTDYSGMSLEALAKQLANLYQDRAEAGLLEWKHERDIEQSKLALTPESIKELGANEAERKNALERIYATDKTMIQLVYGLEQSHMLVERLTAQIMAAEATRRACEWYIRAEMTEALAGKLDRSTYDPASDQVMDAGVQVQIDDQAIDAERAFEAVFDINEDPKQTVYDPSVMPQEEEIPF